VALSLGFLQPDVIWCFVSIKPGLSSLTDVTFRNATIRLPVYKVSIFTWKSKKNFIFYKKIINLSYPFASNRFKDISFAKMQNKQRTLRKKLNFPIDSQKIPCYTIRRYQLI